MEVHQHTHTARKKFTHYLFEFFMLFLAVFCGFLAENFREHIIEHRSAREYAQNLLIDLQRDTTDINRGSRYEKMAVSMIDSLVYYTNSRSIAQRKNGLLYYYMKMAGWMYSIDFNKATMNQLISSGNLRYFTNHELVNLISSYNTNTAIIKDLEQNIQSDRQRAFIYRDQIIPAKYSLQFWKINMDMVLNNSNSSAIDSLRNAGFSLQNNNPDLINNYTNALVSTKTVREFLSSRYYPKAINEATEIITLLKEEYHLK